MAVPEAAAFYANGTGVPAHVTILFPFLAPEDIDEAALEQLFGRFAAFEVRFDRLERFEDGTLWLRPAPVAPFVDLTAAVWQRWPAHAPYEGTHDEVIPHLTVTTTDVALPISGRVTEVLLIEERESDGRWTERRAFALAQGVA